MKQDLTSEIQLLTFLSLPKAPERRLPVVVAADMFDLRVASLRRTLRDARAAIPAIQGLDPVLKERLASRVENRIDEICAGLDTIDRTNRAMYVRRVSAADELVEEMLAFLAAAAARRIGLDQGVTTLAMSWLDRLSDTAELPRIAVVIPAATEFTGMVSSVVRLRVPLDGIWGLPVALHEYGHFVAANLTRREEVEATVRTITPVEDLLHHAATASELPLLYSHGHELFADAFAAATAGPAFPHYCLRYRFEPSAAQVTTATHPSAVRRIRIQLTVLTMLAKDDPNGYLSADISALSEQWHASLAAAGVPPDIPADPRLDQLESDVASLVLEDRRLKRLHYAGHLSACVLAEAGLSTAGRPSPAQIVNAAWRARTRIERDIDDVERATPKLTDVARLASELLERVMADG
jgi:hypothetical protein